MKKINIKPDQMEVLASLYDEGFELFYNAEEGQAYMINDIIEAEEFTNISNNKDTTVIFEVTNELDSLIDRLHLYNHTRKGSFNRKEIADLSESEKSIVKLLSLPLTSLQVSRLVSTVHPDKKFLSIELKRSFDDDKKQRAQNESVINILKSVKGEIYIYQVGKNCKKKVQKKV